MTSETEHGYLVLADISGYTSYLAQTELEHAQEILTDLLATIVDQFKQALTISKLEDDAVFANVNESNLPNGERLLELIESTYYAFRQRRDMCERQTTCTCRACAAIPSLDLKFFVHHGDYIVQNISGIRELVGSDINLIHRLTKIILSKRQAGARTPYSQTGHWNILTFVPKACMRSLNPMNISEIFQP